MYIKKIKVTNFKSFAGEHEIDFNELSGLWWVHGPIGSGKTSIGEAIIFGLFGTVSDVSNKDLITRGEKHSLIEVWCESRGKTLYIKRENNSYGQNPLYVEVDGESIEFTSKKDAQYQLEQEYLDITRTTMELLCIISFNNFKSLSTLNAKDTKQFLDYVLGLDIVTSYVDLCKEEISELRSEKLKYDYQIRAKQDQIDRLSNQTFIEGDIEKEEAAVARAEQTIKDIKALHEPIINEAAGNLRTKQSRLTEIKTLGIAKKKEIDFIKKGVCPTCGAPIDQSHLELKEKERENLIKQYTEVSSDISRIEAHISQEKSKMSKSIFGWEKEIIAHQNTIIRLREQSKQERFNQEEIDKLQNEVEEDEKSLIKVQADQADYANIIDILQTSVKEKVMESFVPDINNKIKEIAGSLRMPYVPEYDLSFKCTVSDGRDNLIPTKSLSTGQLKIVDTVIILAILSSVVTKVHSNVIFMDELFSNLDPRTRSDLLIILRTIFPSDSSTLIVSHQELPDELIEGKVRMELMNQDGKYETKMDIEKIVKN